MQKKDLSILSVGFNTESESALLKSTDEKIKRKELTVIFTPNPQIVLKAQKNEALLSILNTAHISLPDGIGISVGARMLGSPIGQRITGIDFGTELLRLAQKEGYSVFLLGGAKGVAEAARDNLKGQMPGLNICGCNDGYFEKSGKENESVIKKINKVSPDILFVCFGCPAQEVWIHENVSKLRSVKVAMGLGGSLDVWSGRLKRAPRFMQKSGTEWLYRVLREPRRMRIFVDIPIFLRLVYDQKKSAMQKS